MSRAFHLSRFNLAILITNLICFGACLVLLAVRGPNAPLLLLAIGTFGVSMAKIGRGFISSRPVAAE